MADIINLNRARKQRAKQDREQQAAQNRITFGRTKAEREANEQERLQRAALLDGKRLETDQKQE